VGTVEEMLENLERGSQAAEEVLLRVEELQLLISADKPRKLIELAQEELVRAVDKVNEVWPANSGGLAHELASSDDADVRRAWQEFRSLLAACASSAARASAVIATHLTVTEDALAALGVCRQYDQHGALRLVGHADDGRKVLLT